MIETKEPQDRWALLNYFNGDLPVAQVSNSSVKGIPEEVRRKAVAQIWKFARENRRRGHIPVVSANTLLGKKRLRR
jgi:hypothetical protein